MSQDLPDASDVDKRILKLSEEIRATKRYAAAMRQAHQVMTAAQGRHDIDDVVTELAQLSSVDSEVAAALVIDLGDTLDVHVEPAVVLASGEELRALVTSAPDKAVRWVTMTVAATAHLLRNADETVLHAKEEIVRLSGRKNDELVANMVASVLKGVCLALTGPFEQVPPVAMSLAEAEAKLAPLGLPGGLSEAILRAYQSPERRDPLYTKIEVILDADMIAWIMVDFRELTDYNRQLWQGVPKGMSYDDARKGAAPHFDCLVYGPAVLLREHADEYWLAPKLWSVLASLDGARSGTVRKVGNDVPAWEQPKVLLLEGEIATATDADLVTAYARNALGASRKAVLRLRDKTKLPWSRTSRTPREENAGAERPKAGKVRKQAREASRTPVGPSASSRERERAVPVEAAVDVPLFKDVWANPGAYGDFPQRYEKFIADRFAGENVKFLKAVRAYRADGSSLEKARTIYRRYVEVGSDREINTDKPPKNAVGDILRAVERGDRVELATIFDELEAAVINLLNQDMSGGFKREVRAGRY